MDKCTNGGGGTGQPGTRSRCCGERATGPTGKPTDEIAARVEALVAELDRVDGR